MRRVESARGLWCWTLRSRPAVNLVLPHVARRLWGGNAPEVLEPSIGIGARSHRLMRWWAQGEPNRLLMVTITRNARILTISQGIMARWEMFLPSTSRIDYSRQDIPLFSSQTFWCDTPVKIRNNATGCHVLGAIPRIDRTWLVGLQFRTQRKHLSL